MTTKKPPKAPLPDPRDDSPLPNPALTGDMKHEPIDIAKVTEAAKLVQGLPGMRGPPVTVEQAIAALTVRCHVCGTTAAERCPTCGNVV